MSFMKIPRRFRALILMALPGVLILFFFDYMVMGGLVLAFKNFDYRLGIWSSPWSGIENFRFLIASRSTFFTITRNTLMYYVIFTVTGMILEISLAIAMDQLVFKRIGKVMQSIFVIPVFISFTAVQFIVYAFLSTDMGMINHLFGVSVRWYLEAKYWPVILTIVKLWSGTGYGAVLFMSVLAGIDPGLYEAAQMDGAGKWQQIWHITLPLLKPMVTIMLLLSVGGVLHSDTGLFYQVTRNSGSLYDTTQVLDSYILNAVFHNADFGFTAAASFFQSVVGTMLILLANMAVRRINPDDSLF
ncbi:MAG: sugar ABC transporter permease [Lachnospiraceae bacterium]|nr:sugar ABC transporter permease [Lachnospiraceae bacterium]